MDLNTKNKSMEKIRSVKGFTHTFAIHVQKTTKT